MTTTVVNISSLPGRLVPDDDRHVYVGRPGHGLRGDFGSPIVRGKTCPVCQGCHYGTGATLPCYRRWLAGRLIKDAVFHRRVSALRGKILVCFCKPLPCHGDVLAETAEGM